MSTLKRMTGWLATIVLAVVCLVSITNAQSDPDNAPGDKGCYCVGTAGNVDCDHEDRVDIADLQLLIDHLFINYVPLPNRYEANIDGDPMLLIDVADLTELIAHLFFSPRDLPMCPEPFNQPPETYLTDTLEGTYFINGVVGDNPAIGILLSWSGTDLVDSPYEDPSLEYEWRLYGPYLDVEKQQFDSDFRQRVFEDRYGCVYYFGRGITVDICDTTAVPYHIDPSGLLIECTSLYLDSIVDSTFESDLGDLGYIDTIYRVDDSDFQSSPLNRIAVSSQGASASVWVSDTASTLLDVFAAWPSDTTRLRRFLFWVRAREAGDTASVDPTPASATLSVIDPKHERDLMVIDMARPAPINRVHWDSARVYWQETADAWAVSRPADSIVYDDERDYMMAGQHQQDPDVLRQLLSHRTVVLYSDDVQSGVFLTISSDFMGWVFQSIDAGVGAWAATRYPTTPWGSGYPYSGFDDFPVTFSPGQTYSHYWGVDSLRLCGWTHAALQCFSDTSKPCERIEEFIGITPSSGSAWPAAVIDTARLHSLYRWVDPYYSWIDTLGALPEVNWFHPIPQAETMYLYQSLYGNDSPLGYHNKPVMVRLDREHFRTVHSLFTPIPFGLSEGQEMVNMTLDWLYDGFMERRGK